jgi:hypothetical protein
MKEQIPLLNFLRSNRFILYVAIFSVLCLSPNTYYVFHQLSVFIHPYREIFSGLVASLVAASIMIYTLRKNFKVAKYYSIFEVSISAYYYIDMLGWDWRLIPAFSFTLMLPVSVFYYTKEIDVDTENIEVTRWLERNPGKRPSDFYKQNT